MKLFIVLAANIKLIKLWVFFIFLGHFKSTRGATLAISFIQKTTDGTKESFHFKAEDRGLIVSQTILGLFVIKKKKERESGNDFQMQLCIVRKKSSLGSSALLTGCLT